MHKNPIVVANWKMNTNLSDAMVLTQTIKNGFENIDHVEGVLAPPAVWLYPMHEKISDCSIKHLSLCAQNIHSEEEGAYTGEISVVMIKSMVKYVLIGHSERNSFGETVQQSNQKIKLALKYNLSPIVFVGEHQRNSPEGEVVEDAKQLLKGVDREDYSKLNLVYEPLWAISSQKGAEPASASEVEKTVTALKKTFGEETRVLYGGSVNSQNCTEFLRLDDIDGVVVGNDSLNAKHFLEICMAATHTYGSD